MGTLYSYYRSSASFRVRIALNLKGLDYTTVPVHLVRDGGEQHTQAFRALHPGGLVPVWQDERGVLTQSLAIIEYLEERYPDPPLLPKEAFERAQVRALAATIACDIHPLNNLRVLNYLGDSVHATRDAKRAWYHHWVENGLATVEALLAKRPHATTFCHAAEPGLAECFLVPQVTNALRYACRLDHVPIVMSIHERCMTLPAFTRAAPNAQPDFEA